jgi:CBS domain containing-hemolysin-like protein
MSALGLVAAFVLVTANGFFVTAEFTLARVRPTQVTTWERQGRPGARSVRHALEHVDAYLAACQLGITVASLSLGAVGEPAFYDLLQPVLGDTARIGSSGLAAVVAFVIITGLHVVVGELAPKSLAIARTEWAALAVVPPMRLFYLVTKPVVDVLNGMGNLFLKPFGIPPAHEVGDAPPTEEELHELLRESSRRGLIDPDEQLLSETALLLDELRVGDVMVPRAGLPFVTTDMDNPAVIERMRETGVRRLPLCEPDGGLDAPVGLIQADDLLFALDGPRAGSLTDLARPLEVVPDTMPVDEVLSLMSRQREPFVLVHDDRGRTVGGVSLEDIVELMVRGVRSRPPAPARGGTRAAGRADRHDRT